MLIKPLPIHVAKSSLASQAATHVNQAFDAFTSDYLRAQATYLASTVAARETFTRYVVQRVDLLARNLIKTFTPLPQSFNRLPSQNFGSGGSLVLQAFLNRVINGSGSKTLKSELVANVPPSGISGPTATLVTLNATAAIETARTSTLNSVNFLNRHTFQNGKHH